MGQVTTVRQGRAHKEISLTPSGLQNGLDDVLIVIDGVHGTIPAVPAPDQPVHLLAPPGPDGSSEADVPAQSGAHQTDLDRAAQKERSILDAQHHLSSDKNSTAPNYNLILPPAAPGNGAPQAGGPPQRP